MCLAVAIAVKYNVCDRMLKAFGQNLERTEIMFWIKLNSSIYLSISLTIIKP